MDIYGKKVAVASTAAVPARVAIVPTVVGVDRSIFDRLGCLPCTSGDSPLFDLEQRVLFG